jgi:hypothetical protein
MHVVEGLAAHVPLPQPACEMQGSPVGSLAHVDGFVRTPPTPLFTVTFQVPVTS